MRKAEAQEPVQGHAGRGGRKSGALAHEANNGAKREVMDAVFEMPATKAATAGRAKATGGANPVAKEAENGRCHPGWAVRT